MSIHKDTYYCLDCGFQTGAIGLMRGHWESQHGGIGVTAVEGVDFCQGWQLVAMQGRRDEWVERQVELFSAALHPGFGPDDLIAESEIGDA